MDVGCGGGFPGIPLAILFPECNFYLVDSIGKKIKVVSDQWRTPTYVADLATGILLLIEKEATGVFHISGKDKCTPYEMALQTAAVCQLDAALIEKVDVAVFSQPAKRPPKTGFNISKAQKELGYAPVSFEEGLRLTCASL